METVVKAKTLANIVRFLKRAKLIGNDFLIKNDMWIPMTRGPESKPGTHILRNLEFPVIEDKVFLIKDLRLVIQNFEDVEGKKGTIRLQSSYDGLSISLKDGAVIIPIAVPTKEPFPIDTKDFNHYTEAFDGKWVDFSQSQLETIKMKGLIEITSEEGDLIRLAKGNFKLNGVEQAKNAIKYSGKYFASKSNNGQMGNLFIWMDYEFFESVHHYLYAVYQKTDLPFDQL